MVPSFRIPGRNKSEKFRDSVVFGVSEKVLGSIIFVKLIPETVIDMDRQSGSDKILELDFRSNAKKGYII
jgi:hypothetical protein